MNSIIPTIAVLVLLSLIFQHCYITLASQQPATYIVGDDMGWTVEANPEAWARGKKFYAGDILEFKYDYQESNVVVVDKEGHDSCTTSEKSVEYASGDDKIPLNFGENYFICSWQANQCQAGMKMAINATARPPVLPVH